jgi:hypothetical protein
MTTYRLSAHEKLSDIARLHGVTTEAIVLANPEKETVLVPGVGEVFSDLREGEALSIPDVVGAGDPSNDPPSDPYIGPVNLYGAFTGALFGAALGAGVGVGAGFLLGHPARGAGIGALIGAAWLGYEVGTKGIH